MHTDHDVPADAALRAIEVLKTALEPRTQPGGTAPRNLPDQLPADGLGEDVALQIVGEILVGGVARLSQPGFLAHMDPPTPWVTWVTSLWNAALNQNLLHDDTGAAGRAVEAKVVEWLAPLFGMDGGHLVPGSTVANLTALWAARDVRGVRRIVSSDRAHVSVAKSAHILGLRHDIVASEASHRLDPALLGDLSDAALVLTAGTTATGAVDPLDTGLGAAWCHVDAAWAGPLHLTPRFAAVLDGISDADSVAVSAHKWMYQPKESALILFADTAPAHEALTYGGGYLARPNVGLLGSHGAAAVSLLATLLAWGTSGLTARIEHDMATADRLAEVIEADPRFLLWGPNVTGVVAWQPIGVAADDLRNRMENAFVSVTEIDGERWLRSVAANPNADADLVFASAAAAYESLVVDFT